MDCSKILSDVYEHPGGERMPLLLQVRIFLHTIICTGCTEKIERFQACKTILREDFFPASPGLEDSIMKMIGAEQETEAEESFTAGSGLSIRGWAIAGLVILLSLITTFFTLDFHNIVREAGTSYLLPVGITIGIVLTSYGALFIGSHLKELSERFGV